MRVLTWNIEGFTPGLNALATRAEAWARLSAIDLQADINYEAFRDASDHAPMVLDVDL